jgi:hypothetical protein
MTPRRVAQWTVALCLAVVGAGCGGGDDGGGGDGDGNGSATAGQTDETLDPSGGPDDPSSDTAPEEPPVVGFGEIVDGTFVLTGASEEQYYASNTELAYQLSGGCDGGAFGFGVDITDSTGDVPFATFNADLQEDLSGGVTGEFDAVDAEIIVIPNGNLPDSVTYAGPLSMVVSEHDVSAEPNTRRMTITLSGSIPSDRGDLGVDVTFRWAMGCP